MNAGKEKVADLKRKYAGGRQKSKVVWGEKSGKGKAQDGVPSLYTRSPGPEGHLCKGVVPLCRATELGNGAGHKAKKGCFLLG